MEAGITKLIDRRKQFQDAILKLANMKVLVGVPAEKGTRQADTPINNAALAAIHDRGAPEAGIPARPFMRPGIESKQAEITAGFIKAGELAFQGRPQAVDRQFHKVGLIAQAAIRSKMNDGIPPPLADATIEARQRRGRTGTKPLIDTGALRNAINYVIRTGR